MQIKDLDFTPDSGILKLSYFTLINPENSKSYPFISGLTTTYNAKDIEQFYTSRLGAGVPKATHVAIDSIGAMRSIKPLNATVKPKQRRANTEGDWKIGLKNATTPEAKITEEEDEVVLEN